MATKHFIGGRIILGTEFAGYLYRFYEPNTPTFKTTYRDANLTVGNENTQTVTLDANGAAQIWFSGNADVQLLTSAAVLVYSDDDVNIDSSTTAAGSYNSVLNGSFEDDTDGDGVPDNWTRTLYSGGAFALDTTTQSHGDTSARFTSTGTGGGYVTSTAKFPVRNSRYYELSWDMRSSVADVRNVVQIFWYQANGTASATASSTAYDDSTTNPTSWARKSYKVESPSDAYLAEVRLIGCHSSDVTSGNTSFDNVEFITESTLSLDAGITASVATKALTASIVNRNGGAPSASPIDIYFRSATLTTGTPILRAATAATSVVAPNGATLGLTASDTVTMTIASPCVVTQTAHKKTFGTPIRFSTTGALPTGLVAGTEYFILGPTVAGGVDTYNISATVGGAAINTSGTQSGTHTASTGATTGYLYVYAIDNAGTIEAAISSNGSLDEGALHSTTAIGTGSDSADVLYSTTARSNVAIRKRGRIKIAAGAIAGEWDNAPTELHGTAEIYIPKSEPYIYIRDEKYQDSEGGTFTAGAWRTRDLNTEVNDSEGFASLASNQITLLAGTYRFKARAPAYGVSSHKCRLANITDSLYYYGSSAFAQSAVALGYSDSVVSGKFTITASKVFELQHFGQVTGSTTGFGIDDTSSSTITVYSEIEFWKEL